MAYDEKKLKSFCVNGEVSKIVEYLRGFPEKSRLRKQYENRFFGNPPQLDFKTNNPILIKILECYAKYYLMVFVEKKSKSDTENFLNDSLKQTFFLSPNNDLDTTEQKMGDLVHDQGYEFLGGTTSGFYGPYIWKTTEKTIFKVEIPSENINLPVFFMKDFISNSWLSFLSFDKTGTGGWAKEEGLYCRYSAYKDSFEKPSFKISFLKHEAQHYADFLHFQNQLSSTQLEYRAKLCELIYYPNMKLLKNFFKNAKNDERFSHSQAEYWLISDLSQSIFGNEYENNWEFWRGKHKTIQKVALIFLKENKRVKTE